MNILCFISAMGVPLRAEGRGAFVGKRTADVNNITSPPTLCYLKIMCILCVILIYHLTPPPTPPPPLQEVVALVKSKTGLLGKLDKVSKVLVESADRGWGSYIWAFLQTPGKIFHPVSTIRIIFPMKLTKHRHEPSKSQ